MSRKSKFPKFFEQLKLVLNDERTVILTDEELLVLVNDHLDPWDRISDSTWEYWISNHTSKSVEAQASISAEEAAEFRQLLKSARVKQKMNLTANMMDSDNSKSHWANSWILERKFKDLRIKQGNEVNITPTIQIQAGDGETKKLVEGILSGDTIDIDHEEVDESKKLEK